MATILYVDDEPSVGLILQDTLERAGHKAIGAGNVPEALQVLARGNVDLIISDYRMPGLTGLEFLSLLQREGYNVPVIMLTGYGSIEHAVASIKAGAIDYITKPIRSQQLEVSVEHALEFVRLRRENEVLRREVMEFRNERQIIGESEALRRILQTVAMAAPTRATVLLQGESGTGKELFARAVRDQSDRADRPFVKLNCAALPEGLIESALFGHERGAFTGAVKRVEGAFERAHGGTLLLDEVSEMRLDLQAKLLRVLQEQEFERVGGTTPIKVDVRIIATTNRDLAAEVAAGTFRRDLYYRLGVIPILIPSLRERKEDIPLLATRFAIKVGADMAKDVRGVSAEAIAFLQSQDWPGNVRELQHTIERAVILSNDPILQLRAFDSVRFGLADVPGSQRPAPSGTPSAGGPAVGAARVREPAGTQEYAAAGASIASGSAEGAAGDPSEVHLTTLNVAHAERVLISRALEKAGGNRTRAAEMLGISVRTLRNKLNTPSDANRTDQPGD
ncbi:MAG: sigma-54-dependent transcriptional regulator [Gemmatimonadales bacterium]